MNIEIAIPQPGYSWRGVRQELLLKRITQLLFRRIFSYPADVGGNGNSSNFWIMSRKVAANFRRVREQLRFFRGLERWRCFHTAGAERGYLLQKQESATFFHRKQNRL